MKPCGLLSDLTVLCKEATGDQGTLGDIAVSDNHLPGKGGDPVRIVIEITLHAVHQDSLVDIAADQTVIIAFLVPIPVITIKTLVRQIHGPVDIGFDSGLIGASVKNSSCMRRTCSRASTGRFNAASWDNATMSDLP